jgi:RNA polymerase sigma-70 factor, ECF subfamily
MAASVLQHDATDGSEGEPFALHAARPEAVTPVSGVTTRPPESAPIAALSLAEVYEAHAAYVFRCLRGLGVRESHVEDAVHDVFLVVHEKLADFVGPAKLSTWLYAIVLRVARRHRERQARESRGEPEELADERCTERTYLSMEALTLARRALDGLSEDKREVFVLSEIEQLSAPEIATITFAPLNTVYSRLRAARIEFERRVAQLERKGGRHG